jgi:YfiH family protein
VRQHTSGKICWFQFESFADLDGIITHGIFARHGGISVAPFHTLNMSITSGDNPEAVHENRARVRAVLPGSLPIYSARPEHGTRVVEITPTVLQEIASHTSTVPFWGDILISQLRGVAVCWAPADCVPIMIVDPEHAAIAMVHAGWRGTSQAITVAALRAMHEHYGTRFQSVRVGFGPCIGPCCYEVSQNVFESFMQHPIAIQHLSCFSEMLRVDSEGQILRSLRLDIADANRAHLIIAGVPESQIEVSGFCTGCRPDLFYSHRMEGGRTGRFSCTIGLL